jgi:serine/threonine-protein kinase
MLAAAAGLSVFGTAKTEALRREVRSAREAVREMGHYRLRRKLGQGGMGEVYLAEHRLIKRPCALKRIHPRYLNNPEQVRRFEREVQATAALRHPNTVEIYDYGRADDGTFYYVMEYLPGMSLEEMVTKYGPLPPDRVVHVLRQVCGALREAHRHGLVHRDIKPSNVLVFPDGSPHDQAKLLDFGLVHSLTDEVEPEAKITRDGLIVGTPEYMSPEQASGQPIDGRSDLFSLGSVAYFLLTAKEAFHRENPMKTLLAVVNDEPPPIAGLAPFVPDDLRAVIAKCLAKSPGDRYERASALEAAFGALGCADDWTEAKASDWWSARPDARGLNDTDLNSLPLQEPVK